MFDNDREPNDGGYSFAYKFPDLMRSLQLTFKKAQTYNALSDTWLKKTFVKNRGKLADKTLLIETNNVNEEYAGDTEAFEKVYPFKFEVVSPNKVKEAINKQETQYAYFYTANSSGSVFTVVLEAGTGEVLWFQHDNMDEYNPLKSKIKPAFLKKMKMKKFTK